MIKPDEGRIFTVSITNADLRSFVVANLLV